MLSTPAATALRAVVLIAGSLLAFAWLTFPLIVYPYNWFVRPLYYTFRHSSVRREFPVFCRPLPPGLIDGQFVKTPRLLSFEANPNVGVVVVGPEQVTLECGKTTVVLSVWGDRYKGATGFEIESIGGVSYGRSGISELRIECFGACRDPGQNPLDHAVCGGPCSESAALK